MTANQSIECSPLNLSEYEGLLDAMSNHHNRSPSLEVLFNPAEFEALKARDLSQTVCVVFDVLRATSTMVTALGNGAESIIPVCEIADALALQKQQPQVLLAGERNGLRIGKELTAGTPFDLGNSPREFTKEAVSGRRIVMTTTNGTRALRACAHAQTVLAGAFLNLAATATMVEKLDRSNVLLICGGTFEQVAYEDALAAGALCNLLWPKYGRGAVADSAQMAFDLFSLHQGDLVLALSQSRNGQRLLGRPDLAQDVAFCARLDTNSLVAVLDKDGAVRVGNG